MQSTPQTKLSEREIAEARAKITIIKWKKKLAINKVGNSGALFKSFQYDVLASAQGNVLKITLLFEYYGRFVDMGKESITSCKLSGKMLGNRRRPKKPGLPGATFEMAVVASQLGIAKNDTPLHHCHVASLFHHPASLRLRNQFNLQIFYHSVQKI